MERPERFIVLVGGALLNQLTPALWVLAALTMFTAGQRVLHVRGAMRRSAEERSRPGTSPSPLG
jgi:hypothetical protein